jgi:prepilin peptidase CpaA
MFTLSWANWPLFFVSAALIACSVIDGWKLKVPNYLTFPFILSGWLYGLIHTLGLSEGPGGLGASLVGTLVGFALLLPLYAIGGMGAGDVKMQMGFGSWVGAIFGYSPGMWIILCAFCTAAIVGGIIAAFQILFRRQFSRNLANTRAIVGDLFTAPGIGEIADRAAKRKPTMHLLPYGIPLCIGFIGYLFLLHAQ